MHIYIFDIYIYILYVCIVWLQSRVHNHQLVVDMVRLLRRQTHMITHVCLGTMDCWAQFNMRFHEHLHSFFSSGIHLFLVEASWNARMLLIGDAVGLVLPNQKSCAPRRSPSMSFLRRAPTPNILHDPKKTWCTQHHSLKKQLVDGFN